MRPFSLFRHAGASVAKQLYASVVERARDPSFYTECAVPDTPDGRFDMIAIHAFLVLHRLKNKEPRASDLGQAMFDVMFDDMDQNLREMGVGDLGVGRRVRSMAEAFYGRIDAYETGLAGGRGVLEDAIRRNLYRRGRPSDENVSRMADYMRCQVRHLSAQELDRLGSGAISFAPWPAPSNAVPERASRPE